MMMRDPAPLVVMTTLKILDSLIARTHVLTDTLVRSHTRLDALVRHSYAEHTSVSACSNILLTDLEPKLVPALGIKPNTGTSMLVGRLGGA